MFERFTDLAIKVIRLSQEEARRLGHNLTEQGITLEVTERFKDRLVEEGYDSSYGARPLRRAITHLLEDCLAEEILSSRIKDGDTVVVDVDDKSQIKVLQDNKRE